MKFRQGSCFVKDLKKDEVPEFMKKPNMLNIPKTTIKETMFVGLEDESLQKYKESLLGNL